MNVALSIHTSQSEPQRDMSRTPYVPFLQAFGVIPVLIPNNLADVDAYLVALDIRAIVLSGGGDLDPARYHQDNTHAVHVAPERDRTEWALIDAALARDLPILGICRGFQVLNAYFGGGLVQDIPSTLNTTIDHHTEDEFHTVELVDQRIADLLSVTQVTVNSHHHQGVTRDILAPEFDVFAVSPSDPLIEGVLHREHAILAVQWHPERPDCPSCDQDRVLIQRFFTEGAFWLREYVQ
ncbi:MAG: gamma-glutamyl-gamma-aminobutyrate hydrolase family protein [Anaerolineae bacterium]|nr:gamma-glutamyl-gamma-aminobutyrate hydrolase family protein [Anaerolineae bacterium]